MALTGFTKRCARRSGGIRTIVLMEADKVTAVYDAATDGYTSASAPEGNRAAYSFNEDEAQLRETVSVASGSLSVTHELSFSLARMDAASRKAVEEMATASYCGLVALVTTNNGERLLVGYSPQFGAERPLRVSKCVGMSGQKLSDPTSESVTLVSTDTQKARSVAAE